MDSLAPVALETAPREAALPGLLRSRVVRIALVALPLLFGAGKAMASFWVLPQRVDVLTGRSDAVVLGKVEHVDASWEQGHITSDVHVLVTAAYKGRTASEIELHVQGGVVGGIHARVSSEPELRAGDEAVLFLMQHEASAAAQNLHYHVVDGIQGTVPVARDAQGNATVAWVRPETGRAETTPLSSFADYVHAKALEQLK